MVEEDHCELTQAEAELYDRQIRLWGLENQKRLKFSFSWNCFCFYRKLFNFRLRNSKVLIAGLNGLGAEVSKNIILSGIKSVTFLDDKVVTELDFASNFFIPRDQLGKNRAESSLARAHALNPMVETKADTGALASKDESFFKLFDVVVILEAFVSEQVRINNICRANNVKFYAADMWGTFGFSFIDLQEHEYVE